MKMQMIFNSNINSFGPKFEKAINKVFENVSNFYDPKNHSKYGITQKQYPNIDIQNLTKQEAAILYYRDFWSTQLYEKINSEEIIEKLFETAVELGTKTSNILLQRALRSVGNPVKENGILDKITIIAINATIPQSFLAAFRSEIAGFYRQTYSDSEINTEVFLKHAYA